MKFDDLVASITQTGLDWHRETILRNSFRNSAHIKKTLRDVKPDPRPCLIVSAGPSIYRELLLQRLCDWRAVNGYDAQVNGLWNGIVIATDSSYIRLLRAGIVPDWVVTLDPHPTRMVRWFGDPDYAENSKGDDYFARQDLDPDFRKHREEEVALVDANPTKLAICTTAPQNVVQRTSGMDRAWFAPLVDKPTRGSLTGIICAATGCPALNTGGTVGTAAWAFAHQILQSPNIAVIGCDYGYYDDLPLEQTQEWNMLKHHENVEELFPYMDTPHGKCRTSATYCWYRDNFLSLLDANKAEITNCSQHGILFGERVKQMKLEEWLAYCS